MNKNQIGKIIANRFKLIKKLGEGAFGEIFLGVDVNNSLEVAIKIQPIQNNKHPQLASQSKILYALAEQDPTINIAIPNVYFMTQQPKYNIMVMDLLGPSLQDLFTLCDKKFSVKTTLMIGIQMIQLIKYVHSKGILHRDIKPDNFLIGAKKKAYKVFIIDFGLAKKYKNKEGIHIPYRDNKNLTGTARYASINTHIGIQQGRRDDIESFVYVLIYFMKGGLPWQNLKAANKKQKYQRIMQKKLSTPLNVLCQDLPKQIEQILVYARQLHFQHEPNYDMISQKLKTIMQKNKFKMDYEYDWISKLKPKKKEQHKVAQIQKKQQQEIFT